MGVTFNPFTGELMPSSSGGGSDANAFAIIQPDAGTSPTADATNDTLTLTSSDGSVVITGNATTDTVDYSVGNISAAKITSGTLPEARGGTNQSTYAKGDTLYASGANTLSKLPSGSEQSQLCLSSGVPAWQGPVNRLVTSKFEDFINWNTQSMFVTYSGSGGSVSGFDGTLGIPTNTHPGCWKYTSTAATNWMALYASAGSNHVVLGGGETVFETMVYLSALSDATNTYTFYAGFNNNANQTLGTVYLTFSYTHSANSGQWQGLSLTGGTSTTMNSTSAVAAATWYRLTIVVNAAGTLATFYVNGVSIGTISTNLPTSAASNYMQAMWTAWVRSAGTTSTYLVYDYIAFSQVVTR